MPRITYNFDSNTSYRASHWTMNDAQVVSAGSLALRNVSLTYSLPETLLQELYIRRVSVRAQVDNLFQLSASGNPRKPDSNSFIVRPAYTFGVNLSF
jgi:hypothetical protein